MAARWNLEHSLNRCLNFLLVALVTGSIYATEGAAQDQIIRGKIGGNAAFHCPVDPKQSKQVKMLFLQKELSFVNGFYESKNITVKTWQNTRMDRDNMVVHMLNLNVSHEGNYDCIIEYNNEQQADPTRIRLSVTGDYSEPKVTVLARDKNHWIVKCSSHSGYPSSKMTWNTNGSRMVKVLDNNETRDPVTLTFNSSSQALFNCTKDEIQNISCSVGGVTSTQFSVCTSKPPVPTDPTGPIVIAAIVVVVFGIIVIGVLVCHRIKGRRTLGAEAATPAAVRPAQVNGKEGQETLHTVEEETALTGGQDAP